MGNPVDPGVSKKAKERSDNWMGIQSESINSILALKANKKTRLRRALWGIQVGKPSCSQVAGKIKGGKKHLTIQVVIYKPVGRNGGEQTLPPAHRKLSLTPPLQAYKSPRSCYNIEAIRQKLDIPTSLLLPSPSPPPRPIRPTKNSTSGLADRLGVALASS